MSTSSRRRRQTAILCAAIGMSVFGPNAYVFAQSEESFEEVSRPFQADQSSSELQTSSLVEDEWEEFEPLNEKNHSDDTAGQAERREVQSESNLASVALYRLYNPNTGEHFYTTSAPEKDALVKAGWKDEKTAWQSPADGRPVYRLYNPNASDHHYTLDVQERSALIKAGWKDEGIRFYSNDEYGRSVYRLYNPNAKSGSHHYTLSKSEADALIKAGWKDEGRSFYAVSDYVFTKDEASQKMRCTDAKGNSLIGRQKIYDDWYEFDGDGLMKTGWVDELETIAQNESAQTESESAIFEDDSTQTDSIDFEADADSSEAMQEMQEIPASEQIVQTSGQADDPADETHEASAQTANAEPSSEAQRYTSRRYYDSFGRQLFGLQKLDGFWYCFDGDRGSALFLQEVSKNGKGFYFGADGKALSGRFFLFPNRIDTDGQGTLRHEDFGWKQAGATLHALRIRQAQLQPQADAIKAANAWNASNSDPASQVVIAEWTVVEEVFASTQGLSVHSVYNPNSGEHFYTADQKEIASLVKAGWKDEGVRFLQPNTSSAPVYRLYNRNSGDHHYTISEAEADALVRTGWKKEGIAFYSAQMLSIPVYRLCNPNAKVGTHHYTQSRAERDALVELGWRDEGEGWKSVGLYSIVSQERNGQTGIAIYDPNDKRLSGLQDVYGDRYYLDPAREGFARIGETRIPDGSGEIEVRFDEKGRMIFGEYKENGALYYYQRGSGKKVRAQFIQYGSPASVFYHNENGQRVYGRQTIKGRSFFFDEKPAR